MVSCPHNSGIRRFRSDKLSLPGRPLRWTGTDVYKRQLIGVLFTLIIWAVALEVFIWPCRAGYQKSRELMESRKQEAAGMEFYLSHYDELEQKLNEWENLRNKEDFFYRNIDDTFMDRNLQAMAARAGVSICRMSIGEAVLADFPYDTEMDDPEDSGKEAPGNGPAGGTVMESVITMEIECPDAKGVMTFSDEIYREQKSVLVSFLDVEAVYESGEGGQGTYQGMKGIMEVRYCLLYTSYEVFHGVKITDSALVSAATLSDRYITDRFLPDKAIDLVDEACAMVKTELDSMPAELDDLNHKITQLQIEQASLQKETDEMSKQRLAAIEKEMAELRDSFNSKKAQWENEKNAINKVQSLRAEVETTKAEIEKATRNGDYAKAGQLQYGKLPDLQRQLEAEEKIAADKKEQSLLRDRVTAEEISRIVARWTGIPVEKLVEGEREKLLRLPEVLHQRVIGQDEAVQKVSDAILRSRAGIANPNRPIGSFLFLGPTGVGKTELAKALAQALFDDEKNMVRIDMTEYMEKFSVSRLIGAPPGYVGYEEGGQLTEAVRRHPYSVVLFDEVEKAHPDVFNILLQVLDDGRITDSQGRTVDFKNTIIILTSNLGSDIILEDLEKNRANGKNELSAEARDKIDLLLKRQFRPEFLNRLDDIVYYKSLTKDEIGGIVDLMLADLRSRLADKQLKLVVTDAAKSVIVDDGYDPIYGARPLKRYIQANVETMIAKEIIGGNHVPGDTLTVDAENGKLVLR